MSLTERILFATAFDYCDALFWRDVGGQIVFFVNCNDLFYWGCSDVEQITPANIEVLEQSIKDADALKDYSYGCLLFCCRSRKLRPQGAFYKEIDSKLWSLFDACGPKRPAQTGNPVAHPVKGQGEG